MRQQIVRYAEFGVPEPESSERKGGSHEYHKDGSMFLFQYSTHINVHVGRKREGTHVYDKEGSIGLFGYTTNVYLRVPRYTRVTYIKVIVYAISPPKVDFNEVTNVLTIAYSWVQITFSSYSVSAKALCERMLISSCRSRSVSRWSPETRTPADVPAPASSCSRLPPACGGDGADCTSRPMRLALLSLRGRVHSCDSTRSNVSRSVMSGSKM
ncbi:hypothetical protein MSG28_006918 [Choristoneura fumiferana]|uniref:Uncharacterized protein n=1 Tax=Choristoneura fumiferana TaxID=7141 RepID=A0ACC0JLT6_CHOFU|nr:hypothetical protein MSG28_006918 [Choristoneura fumiferana]